MPQFTTENAAQAGKRGVVKREMNRKLRASLPHVVDEYVIKRVARVRKQIERLSDMMDKEENPQAIDRIAAAIDRLAKHEHYLAGRPGPGNLKPVTARQSHRLAPAPQPVVDDGPGTVPPSTGTV